MSFPAEFLKQSNMGNAKKAISFLALKIWALVLGKIK